MLGHRADEVTEDDDDDVEIEEMAGPNRSSKRSHESDSNETDLVPKDLIWLVIVVCSFKFVSHRECVILTVEICYVLIRVAEALLFSSASASTMKKITVSASASET